MNRTRTISLGLAMPVLLVVVVLAGCASKAEPKAAQPAAGPGAGKTLLVATQRQTSDSPPASSTQTQTVIGPVQQDRDQAFVFEQTASDPRASGTIDLTAQADIRADNSGEIWGTWVLKNSDGTWEGDFSSTMSAENAPVANAQYIRMTGKGTGAYAGLALSLQGYGPPDGDEGAEPGSGIILTGWIRKSE